MFLLIAFQEKMSEKPRVCIIGCGPSGMSALYHFSKLTDEERPDIVCFEKQKTWGGQWNPTWRTGKPVCTLLQYWTGNTVNSRYKDHHETHLYSFDPNKPHFYTVKLGFTRVYISFFLFLLKNIDCGYLLEPPCRGGSNKYPQPMFRA